MKLLPMLAIAAMLSAGSLNFPSALACDATPFVRNAGAAMMGAARTRSPAAFSGVASRYTDMNSIALFALGQHRGALPKARQGEYVALTKGYVGRFMAKHAGRFKGTGITVTKCSGTGKNMTVNAKLSGGQPVVFKLYKTRSGYRVRDLNVSSIWLAQQLRSTFTGVLKRNGGDVNALLRYLKG